MADYTDLPDTAVGVGGTPSGTTVTALRDNPIAIAEGAVGAPRIADAALVDVTSGFIGGKTAGLAAGAVGTYAFLGTEAVTRTINFGDTLAGSALFPAGIRTNGGDGFNDASPAANTVHVGQNSARAGTWRCVGTLGNTSSSIAAATLWLRIS